MFKLMSEILFQGERYRITTDGKSMFFLYMKSDSEWKLEDKNSFEKGIFEEALNGIRDLLTVEMTEEEMISKLSENGFFRISNLQNPF